ncbi:MAG: hypothetical protein GPI96_09870 [Microcystis aeruginosa BS13-02]|jgi:hypothetical protein|nr:hypothetical protein [Microcystis aeruginosa BS13-02]
MKNKVLTPEYIFQTPFCAFLFILVIILSYPFIWFMCAVILFVVELIIEVSQENYDIISRNLSDDLTNLFSVITTIVFFSWLYKSSKSGIIAGRISNAYTWSIKEALRTEYPEGIIYILDNTLKQFKRFGLDLRPYKVGAYSGGLHSITAIMVFFGKRSEVMGFPNLANLKEARNMAQDLCQEWLHRNSTERSRAMSEIRHKIAEEDMLLIFGFFVGETGFGWKKVVSLSKVEDKNVYWYSYTEEDHHNNQSFSNPTPPTPPTPQTPTPKPQPPSNTSQVLSFEEWVNQNPALQHFSEQEQREAYQRYSKSQAVNILSFDEWLTENPALQYFSEEEQKQAYQRYLDSLRGN